MQSNEFESSDEESTAHEFTQFDVSWLSLQSAHYALHLGICSLPGCKFKDIRRNLLQNLEELKIQGIQEVFVFCTLGELSLYRVPTLLQEYQKHDFSVHHYPILDGGVPEFNKCCLILKELKSCLDTNRKTVIHCYGGLGRSCLIAACLLLYLSESVTPQEAMCHIRTLRGTGAIQTIKKNAKLTLLELDKSSIVDETHGNTIFSMIFGIVLRCSKVTWKRMTELYQGERPSYCVP